MLLVKLKNVCSRLSPLAAKAVGREPYLDCGTLANDIIGGTKRLLVRKGAIHEIDSDDSSLLLLRTPSGDLIYWPGEYPSSIVDHVHNELTDKHWPDNYFRLWKPLPGDVVFDVGACEGLFGYRVKDIVAQVHLFEPTPRIATALRRTFQKEISMGRAVVHQCALGDQERVAEFAINLENLGGSAVAESAGVVGAHSVRMTTIDKVVIDGDITRLDLIKMDIEGAELQALRGAVDTMHRLKPDMLICTYHRDDDIPAIPAFLARHGYAVVNYICSYRQYRLPRYWPKVILASCRRGRAAKAFRPYSSGP